MEKKNGFRINSESINQDFFVKMKNAKMILKKKELRGAIIGMTGLMVAFGMASSISKDKVQEKEVAVASEIGNDVIDSEIPLVGLGAKNNIVAEQNTLSVDLNDVNSLNVILNDNKCSSTFFNEVCEELEEDGLSFTATANGANVDVNNSVVITLDQLYMSGPGMAFFSPYDNERLGDSDALALAMETGFEQNEFSTDGIFAGKIGYRETNLGQVQSRVPTTTEEAIGKDKNTSFVTVSFGTNNLEAEKVAQSIENALARYAYYQNEKAFGEDLIYRVGGGDIMADVEKRFSGCSAKEIDTYNKLEDSKDYVYMDDTLRNPNIAKMNAFDKACKIELSKEKENRY